MEKSLFEIKRDYEAIVDELEINGGELTEELEQQLAINEEEVVDKLDNYRKIIINLENETVAIKEEINRLKAFSKTKENTAKRLKESALDAVITFGQDGKSGNKVFNLPDCKFFTRTSKSFCINEERLNILINCFLQYMEGLVNNELLVEEHGSISEDAAIGEINKIAKEQYNLLGEFTKDDLHVIKINLSVKTRLSELLKADMYEVSRAYFSNIDCGSDYDIDANKSELKADASIYSMTIGEIETKQNLQIK